MFKQMLKDFLLAYGPSGREDTVAEVITRYVAPHCDDIYRDTMGNLIAVKKGTSGKKIMLSAHMDQIGLIVVDIDDKGFLRISNVGGVNPAVAGARKVVFENGTEGVTGWETKGKTLGTCALADLFVDIGATDRASAEAKVNVGDMCVFKGDFTDMGDRCSCGAMDNRVACAVMAEAMIRMQSEHDVYAVFTVQEEVGCRGAGPAAFAIKPDLNINIDTTLVGDTPECPALNMALGNGATVKAMDASVVVPPCVRRFLINVAEKNGITWQNEVLRAGGTDTGAVQRTRDGILAGCVSIPTRYIHTPVETVSLSDTENAVKLLCAACAEKELPTRGGVRPAM